jgi:isocitrate dehydrogenase
MPETAELVHNAWLRTIEDGIHTYDVFTEGISTQKVGTKEFAAAVIARLGQKPNTLKAVRYARRQETAPAGAVMANKRVQTELKGIDLFVNWPSRNTDELGDAIGKLAGGNLTLQMIDNRGVKVWPNGNKWTFCTDSYRCRFVADGPTDMGQLVALLGRVAGAGIGIAATQTLNTFDGQAGYTLAQGQ